MFYAKQGSLKVLEHAGMILQKDVWYGDSSSRGCISFAVMLQWKNAMVCCM